MELEDRIIEAFRDATGAPGGHGAKAWFACMGRVDPSTVTRWYRGEGADSAEGPCTGPVAGWRPSSGLTGGYDENPQHRPALDLADRPRLKERGEPDVAAGLLQVGGLAGWPTTTGCSSSRST